MTARELVDQIISFYAAGNKPGYSSKEETCLYFVATDQKCAIGCSVPNAALMQRVSEELNTNGVLNLYKRLVKRSVRTREQEEVLKMINDLRPSDLLEDEQIRFLEALQNRHDSLAFGGYFTVEGLQDGLEKELALYLRLAYAEQKR